MKTIILLLATCSLSFGKNLPGFDNRIVGGVETTIEEFPYQVSVYYDREHSCGGSILDELTILTACHCVHRLNRDKFSVRVGSTVHFTGKEYKVSKIIEHSYYNKEAAYDNDVALLKLETPLKFSNQIQPIKLQSQNDEVPAEIEAVVSGWGATEDGSEDTPDILRKTEVETITEAACENAYGVDITIHMMCAQAPLRDSCQGDSGGPLVANGKQIGIVSWGIGCARPEYPGVYSKISSLHDWIVEHTRQ